MSDYMIQKADDQIEMGLRIQDSLREKKTIKRIYKSKIKCDCCLEKKKLNKKIGFLRGVSYNYYLCNDCEEEAYKEMNKRGDY